MSNPTSAQLLASLAHDPAMQASVREQLGEREPKAKHQRRGRYTLPDSGPAPVTREPMLVLVPIHTESLANARGHWRAKAKTVKNVRCAVAMLLSSKTRRELPAVVTLTRISWMPLDDDNLGGALKPVRDEVAEWIGTNDRSPLWTWRCRQESCKRGNEAVRISIEPTKERTE